jgi:oligopeptide transport system permease protein
MVAYIIRRVLWTIPVIFAVSVITFTLMHLTPGGPWDTASSRPVPEQVKKNIIARYGGDKPIVQQYVDYMSGVLRGDLGPSFSSPRSVNSIISEGFAVSMPLGIAAVLLASCIGIPLGVISALRHNSWVDQSSMFLVTIGISVPSFVTGLLFIVFFSVTLHVLPYQYQRNQPLSWIMPVVLLALGPTALLLRLTRSATLEVLGEDYVRTARAKGLSNAMVNRRHVLRNALIPVITLLGPITAGLVTGAFVIESIFGIPGIGRSFLTSVTKRDYGLLMGTTLFLAIIIVFFNLLVDLTYAFIDPRISRN